MKLGQRDCKTKDISNSKQFIKKYAIQIDNIESNRESLNYFNEYSFSENMRYSCNESFNVE